MAYFSEDKIKAAASLIVDNVNNGVTNDADAKARQYLLDYANYLDIIVQEKGILVNVSALREFAETARRIAKLQIKEKPMATTRPLYEIAREIRKCWPNVWFGAKPYLQAMGTLTSINDNYGLDSGQSIVLYFLANAAQWRGEDARRIKAELKAMCK